MVNRTKKTAEEQCCIAYGAAWLLLIAVTLIAVYCQHKYAQLSILIDIAFMLFALLLIAGIFLAAHIFIKYDFINGWKYGSTVLKLNHSLTKQFIDAGIYIESKSGYALVPKVQIRLSKDLSHGILAIENSIRFNKKFDQMDISPALGSYVIDTHYMSDDLNSSIYEIVNIDTYTRQVFTCMNDIKLQNAGLSPYLLCIDVHNSFFLQSILICGYTGSGKTYAVYYLIAQMRTKNVDYHLYLADPKRSSLYVLGKALELEHNAAEVSDIIDMLQAFDNELQLRKEVMESRQYDKLDAAYSYFGLSPHVLIFDEFAAFMSVLQTYDKSTRDRVMSYLKDIVLMGRQLGMFIFVLMQKSDATTIPTAIRDNLTLKIVLGNAEDTTYVTTFGAGTEIPKRKFKPGEGVYIQPGMASVKVCAFPTLDMDILEEFKSL